jgi:hypothetical protein
VLFNILTDGLFSVNVGMWLLAVVVMVYVGLGGLRSVAYVDTVQCILLWLGICAIGLISVNFAGGWDSMTSKFADIVAWIHSGGANVPGWADAEAVKVFLANKDSLIKLTPDGYSHLVAVPGVIQMVPAGSQAVGGAWTGVMILTYMFALMGIHASPAFSMWAFANKDPKPFPMQQVWASTLGIGFALFIFTSMQGMGGWVLALFRPEGASETVLPLANLVGGKQANLVPYLIHLCGLHVHLFGDVDPRYYQAILCQRDDHRPANVVWPHHRSRYCHIGLDLCLPGARRHRHAGRFGGLVRFYDVPGPDGHTLLALADPPGRCCRTGRRHHRRHADLQI